MSQTSWSYKVHQVLVTRRRWSSSPMTDPLQKGLQLSLPHSLGKGYQGLGVIQDLVGFDMFEHTAGQTSDNPLELQQLLTGDVPALRHTQPVVRRKAQDCGGSGTVTFNPPSFFLTRACIWPCVHCTVKFFCSSLKASQGIMESCLTDSSVTLRPSLCNG